MKNKKILFAVFLLMVSKGLSAAQPAYELSPRSDLHLKGKSNIHAYTSRATEIHASAELAPAVTVSGAPLKKRLHQRLGQRYLKKFGFSVPVQKMRSGKAALDRNMKKALNADQYSDITFELQDYGVVRELSDGVFLIQGHGWLTLAGVRRSIDLSAQVEVDPNQAGQVVIRGDRRILMTDFDVSPPTALGGLLKTDPEVIVYFNLVFQRNPS